MDMGDRNWSYSWNCWVINYSLVETHSNINQKAHLLSDIYATGSVTTATGFNTCAQGYVVARNGYKHIGIKDSNYTTTSDFKEGVTGHQLAYKLATPVTYPITAQNISTLRGANTIYSNSNDVTEITYFKHGDDAYTHIPVSNALSSNDNFILVTDDGYVIGDSNDYIVY